MLFSDSQYLQYSQAKDGGSRKRLKYWYAASDHMPQRTAEWLLNSLADSDFVRPLKTKQACFCK
ncbi:hypothetical protein ACU8KH_05709 [Lachancea thermotolerans]